jgi:hypothetical protein
LLPSARRIHVLPLQMQQGSVPTRRCRSRRARSSFGSSLSRASRFSACGGSLELLCKPVPPHAGQAITTSFGMSGHVKDPGSLHPGVHALDSRR